MGNFVVRGVLPTLLAILLFVISIFMFFIPSFEKNIMARKREMIRELTTAAWNILANFEHEERTGNLSRKQAQINAIAQIKNLQYGSQMKDYFWINDMHPRMVIHPYRSDLNGKDLSNFVDPHGKKLFVEFVKIVKQNGAGFVSYHWQWKDDPTKIVPKLSYVKGFSPWGWIIGTGIYLDDVSQEISAVTHQLIFVSLGILGLVMGLLSFILWGTWKTDKLRKFSEKALKESEERYRLLVESAGDSFIMSLEGEGLYANQSMLKLLGYTSEEFSTKNLEKIVIPTQEEEIMGCTYYQALLQGKEVRQHYEAGLKSKDGSVHRVLLSLSKISHAGSIGFSLIASRLTPQHERELNRTILLDELQQSLMFFHGSVENLPLDESEKINSNLPLNEVFETFQNSEKNVILVQNEEECEGLISREDLLAHFNKKTVDSTLVAGELVSSKLMIPGKTLLFDAFLKMEKQDFKPLIVKSEKFSDFKILSFKHLLQLQSYSPTILFRGIQDAKDERSLIKASRRGPELVQIMFQNGARTRHINQFITTMADMVLEQGIKIILGKLPPPPVPFAFLVTGSEGRREQTLCTDQDNGIIFADVPSDKFEETQNYFLNLGKQICSLLDSAGYSFCKGKIMAQEKRWCQPLTTWKKYFSTWARELEPKDLLETKIFLDFRCGFGDSTLINELWENFSASLSDNPRFFVLLAMDVLQFEPPIGMFGNFILESSPNNEEALNIKAVMVRIVDFARIYALRHGIKKRSTFERLRKLKELGVLTQQSYQEVTQAYGYLMRLRLQHQINLRENGKSPDNFIRPSNFSAIDQKMLKEIFSQIKHFQMRLSGDFTGVVGHG